VLGEGGNQLPALGAENVDAYFDSGCLQKADAAAGDLRVGIDDADTDPADAGSQNGFDAGTGPTVMGTGFESDEKFGATSPFSGLTESEDLGVRLSGLRMIPFADHFAIAHDNGTDRRVGSSAPFTQAGEFESTRHVTLIPGHAILQAPGLRKKTLTDLGDATVNSTFG
jgi:hypothetical protein